MVEWIEERARAHGSAETRIATLAQDERAACLLRSRGFAQVRTFFRMMIGLSEQPPAPGWPDGYVVATLQPGEERGLYEVLEGAFLDHWDHSARTYEEWLVTQKIVHDLCFLVRAGDELAAAALCTIDDFGVGWVDILGTRRDHRRRGLGEALLGQSFHTLYARGARKVALGVDAESLTGATRLYERVGMHVASRIDLYAKTL
jgi:ribosomal protein S18 acetylase RimI-like enzyme